MLRLAHISDIHLGPLPPVRRRELVSKRITGYLNWQRNRSDNMGSDTLDALITHMLAAEPDHVAVTGDLINLALKEEIRLAALWLERVGVPEFVSVVPGNHDTYVRGALAKIIMAWQPYMQGDEAPASTHPSITFPYLRQRKDVALIGVNSGRATLPFYATGSFRSQQARQTTQLLRKAKEAGLFRLVMIHHPPFPKATANHKRLIGASRFRNMIAKEGADLIIHGHTHIVSHEAIAGPDGPVPVIGVPSASASPFGLKDAHAVKRPPARYNLFEIERKEAGWHCLWKQVGYQPGSSAIDTISEDRLL